MARGIKAREKLSRLYQRGQEVRFCPGDDGQVEVIYGDLEQGGRIVDSEPGEDDVTVWVAPPSPLQREMALRDAQASRAKALLNAKRDTESVDHLTVKVFVSDMGDETLIDYLLLGDSDTRRQEAIREVLGRPEWEDMTAFTDAMAQYEDVDGNFIGDDPEDPEYLALLELDAKYSKQVQEAEAELIDAARDALRQFGRPELERRAIEKRAEIVGSQAFMKEYERQMLFYAVREGDDHGALVYPSAKELAAEAQEIQDAYGKALKNFIMDVGTAKNSPRVAPGSEQSEPPSQPETSEASTPEVASA